jgi:cell wall assembly regulator SMI1
MKKIDLVESEENITLNDISEFEKKFNLVLPDNYKKLILKFNGGVDSMGDSIFSELYSIKYGDTTVESAIHTLQMVEQNIPRDYLPFAITGIGDQITLYLKSGYNYGNIYLFRYDELEPRKIADSLEELLGVKSIDEL